MSAVIDFAIIIANSLVQALWQCTSKLSRREAFLAHFPLSE